MGVLRGLTCTPNARVANHKPIRIQRKPLQVVGVANHMCRIGLCKLQRLVVLAMCEVVNDQFRDLWHMEEPVDKIGGKEDVGGRGGNLVAQRTHLRQRAADTVRHLADNGLLGGILAAPVSGPSGLVAVAVNVVAAEENARFVPVEELVEPTNDFSGGAGAEVFLKEGVVGAIVEDIITSDGDEFLRERYQWGGSWECGGGEQLANLSVL
jgi:hypothetical protein